MVDAFVEARKAKGLTPLEAKNFLRKMVSMFRLNFPMNIVDRVQLTQILCVSISPGSQLFWYYDDAHGFGRWNGLRSHA